MKLCYAKMMCDIMICQNDAGCYDMLKIDAMKLLLRQNDV